MSDLKSAVIYCKPGKCPARGRVYHYDDRTAYKWQCCGSQKKEPDGHELFQSEVSSIRNTALEIYCSVANRAVDLAKDLSINEYSYGTRYKWKCCGSQAREPEFHSMNVVTANASQPAKSSNTNNNPSANSTNTNASSSTSMHNADARPVPPSEPVPANQKPHANRARRTKDQDYVIYSRLGGTCYLCKKKLPPFEERPSWHVDHVIPFSKRKDLDLMGNFLPAHANCNLRKSNKLVEEMDVEAFTLNTEALDASFLFETVREKLKKAKSNKHAKRNKNNAKECEASESDTEDEEDVVDTIKNIEKFGGDCGIAITEKNPGSEESHAFVFFSPKPNSVFACGCGNSCLRKEKKLGSGAHGAVWQSSSDCNPHRKYAIKNATYPQFQKYLIQELCYLTEESFRASNLFVSCYGWTTQIDGSFGLVLEYLYSDFNKILKENKSTQHYRGILVDTAKAIVFLHEKELLHRDIKPSNVLITDKFGAKLCDFGLITESARTMKTNCGTAHYRAPEIRSGKYGMPADVYAFGMILSEVIQRSTSRLSYLSKLQLEICGDDYTKTRPEARPTSREVLTRMLQMPGSATSIC